MNENLSPQGYNYGGNPKGNHPFWDTEDEGNIKEFDSVEAAFSNKGRDLIKGAVIYPDTTTKNIVLSLKPFELYQGGVDDVSNAILEMIYRQHYTNRQSRVGTFEGFKVAIKSINMLPVLKEDYFNSLFDDDFVSVDVPCIFDLTVTGDPTITGNVAITSPNILYGHIKFSRNALDELIISQVSLNNISISLTGTPLASNPVRYRIENDICYLIDFSAEKFDFDAIKIYA